MAETLGEGEGEGGSCGVAVAHGEAHGRLQGRSGPGLAADMIEGEEEVVVLGHAGRKSQLEFLVEFGRPGKEGQGLGAS